MSLRKTQTVSKLRWTDFAEQAAVVHTATLRLQRGRFPLHRHGFSELFWVTSGEGSELRQQVDGRLERRELQRGDYAWVTPQTVHGFEGRRGLTLTNAAVRVPVDASRVPQEGRLSEAGVLLMDAASGVLTGRVVTEAEQAAWLLQTLRCAVAALPAPAAADGVPRWLHEALQAPERWRSGVADLVAVCGYSREHVARACRRSLGRTPTELVNEARLDHAATLLREAAMGGRPGEDAAVAAVAEDAGFHNLGHFHRRFRERFGVTPAVYRRRASAVVGR